MKPYYKDGSCIIYHGDCVEKMREMPENSVDSVVCDPPYDLTNRVPDVKKCRDCGRILGGMDGKPDACPRCGGELYNQRSQHNGRGGFMGKEWDSTGVAFDPNTWVEALRVLKPGGYLLAFGGTRTYHRLACAIEDAGFEIRDTLQWVYASGFPKSANISKHIDKRGGNGHLAIPIARALKEARTSRGIGLTKADKMFCDGTTNYSWFEGRPAGQRIPPMETFARICEEWPELKPYADEVAEAEREVVGKSTTGGAAAWINGMNNKEDGAGRYTGQTEWDITAPATDAAKQWEGWGSALKPAHEPIVCARKPLSEKNLAQNVMRWGTGGLNIDESRVSTHEQGKREHKGAVYEGVADGYKRPGRSSYTHKTDWEMQPAGRFPSNLLLSHSPGCIRTGSKRVKGSKPNGTYGTHEQNGVNAVYGKGLNSAVPNTPPYGDPDGKEEVAAYECEPSCPVRLMDEQSGVSKSAGGRTIKRSGGGNVGSGKASEKWYTNDDPGFGDTGGASRFFQQFLPEPDTTPGFFYSPKASRAERNRGLEGMPEKAKGVMQDDNYQWRVVDTRPGRVPHDAPKAKAANHHPTVKPVKLLSYLIRLVTPPNGTVLDCFAGSGSTGVAALSMGFNAILIEQDEEYCNIAQARCRHALNPTPETPKKNSKARNTYGFKTTDVLRRCPEHNEPIPSGGTTYKCGCEKIWYKVNKEAEQAEDLTLFEEGA